VDAGSVTAATALSAAVITGIGWAGRHAWRFIRRVVHFLDDYTGQPEHDGLPAKPGLMARVSTMEDSLAHVVAETSPNHGRSIRDIVLRTAADVTEIKQEQFRVRGELERLKQHG
jgi:hypothetical protein